MDHFFRGVQEECRETRRKSVEMGNGSMSKSASALHFGASIEKDLSEKGNVSEQDAFALKEEPGKESEYTAFVETLLAM